MWFKAIVTTCALLLTFKLSNAAYDLKQCYECEHFDKNSTYEEGKNDEKCKENPPNKSFLVNCSDVYNVNDSIPAITEWQCIKVTGRIEIDEENFNYIKRACSPGKSYDSCKDCKNTKTYQTKYGFVKRGKLCVCDESDGCNTANGLSLSLTTVAAGIMFAIFSKF